MSVKFTYPPLDVYKNLHYFLGYRKLELVNANYASASKKKSKPLQIQEDVDIFSKSEESEETSDASESKPVPVEKPTAIQKQAKNWIADKEFIDLIQWEKYCMIEAKDGTNDRRIPKIYHNYCTKIPTKTFIIIFDKDYDVKSVDLTKILNRLPGIKADSRAFNMDVILITEHFLSIHPVKKIAQTEFKGSDKLGYISIINQLYILFNFDVMSRVSISPHRILPKDEEESVLKSLRITKAVLPKISAIDPMCILIGAVISDTIEILGFNENTGQECRYRVVRT